MPAEIPPNWQTCGRLLSVREVMAITGFSYWTILGFVKSGTLCPAAPTIPYKFDPSHILAVFFKPQAPQPATVLAFEEPRSLKIEDVKGESVSPRPRPFKPVSKGDLWAD